MLPSGHVSSQLPLNIFCSPAAASRLDAGHQFIESFEPSAELLLVGETCDAVDDLAREALCTRAAFEAFAADRLDYLAPVARLRSMGRTLAGTLGDLAFLERDSDIDPGAWTVVDFKTDKELDVALDVYRRQVALYAEMVTRATGKVAVPVLVRV